MKRGIEYTEHTVRLGEPAADHVRDAFAALPRRGCLEAVCAWERRLEILAALEEVGAFAIRFTPTDGFASVRIEALKGKSGPCYDTGRSAVYRGDAAALLDDDRHLIVGTIRVCEKTGGIYALWPYRGVLEVSEPDPELLARLDSEPVPFDCNTFDADCRRLAEMLENAQRSTLSAQFSPVVYPGPFRAVVLKDGSVVRRGVAALVPESQAGQSGLVRLPPAQAREARPCETYAAACRERGSAFILEPLGSGAVRVTEGYGAAATLDGAALAALWTAPQELKRRLLQLIEAREPYLVLTGSDPDVAGGCCPSTQVGAANRLVAAGALQSYAPPAPPESCTATFYAFPGEIGEWSSEVGDRRPEGERPREPSFCLCEPVRVQAEAVLRDERWEGLKSLARRGLLVLLGVSLGLSAWRTLEPSQTERESRLCAVCDAAARMLHLVAEQDAAHAAGAASLGALAAVQPCAFALFLSAVSLCWRPGGGSWANAGRSGVLAAGAGVSNTALTVAAAWGLSRVFGDMADSVKAFSGPLMILGGMPLTGLFRIPVRQASGKAAVCSLAGLFVLGAVAGLIWCPVGAGLFAGVLLPSAILRETPVRDALLYGAGYTAVLLALCGVLAAGYRGARLRSAGRFVSVAAGWFLVCGGVALMSAGMSFR